LCGFLLLLLVIGPLYFFRFNSCLSLELIFHFSVLVFRLLFVFVEFLFLLLELVSPRLFLVLLSLDQLLSQYYITNEEYFIYYSFWSLIRVGWTKAKSYNFII
jgi:hypothetical protein